MPKALTQAPEVLHHPLAPHSCRKLRVDVEIGHHYVMRSQSLVRQASAIVAIAVDSALTTGWHTRESNTVYLDWVRVGSRGENVWISSGRGPIP